MQIVNGKHYAISRVPDDEVAVIPNHYTIHEPGKNFRGYENLISYAQKRGWYNGSDFDFAKVYQSKETYGIEKNTFRHVKAFEILLDEDLSGLLKKEWQGLPFSVKPTKLVEIETLKKILRAHNHENYKHADKPISICNYETLESHIVQIKNDTDKIIIRKALGRPCISPYLFSYFGKIFDLNSSSDDGDKALFEHFKTTPEELDDKNNSWCRSLEIQEMRDKLGAETLKEKLKIFENSLEEKIKNNQPSPTIENYLDFLKKI